MKRGIYTYLAKSTLWNFTLKNAEKKYYIYNKMLKF